MTRHVLAGDIGGTSANVFAAAYGTAPGNLALTILASGRVYIAGGMAPKIIRLIGAGAFMAAFCNKGGSPAL